MKMSNCETYFKCGSQCANCDCCFFEQNPDEPNNDCACLYEIIDVCTNHKAKIDYLVKFPDQLEYLKALIEEAEYEIQNN